MSIHRVRLAFEGQFVQIPNSWMRDTRISRRAKGLLAEIMTHSEGWEITIESLIEKGTEGRDAIRGAIKELEDAGYLRRERRRDSGRYGGVDYVLQEPPEQEVQVLISSVGKTDVGFANVGETPTKNTISKEHHLEEHHVEEPEVPQQEDVPLELADEGEPVHRPRSRKRWRPSPQAWETAVTEYIHYLDKQDLGTIVASYELWCHEKKKEATSAGWLRWVLREEQATKEKHMEKMAQSRKREPWHAVAE
jgi:hypothetical protein